MSKEDEILALIQQLSSDVLDVSRATHENTVSVDLLIEIVESLVLASAELDPRFETKFLEHLHASVAERMSKLPMSEQRANLKRRMDAIRKRGTTKVQ